MNEDISTRLRSFLSDVYKAIFLLDSIYSAARASAAMPPTTHLELHVICGTPAVELAVATVALLGLVDVVSFGAEALSRV